MNLLSVFPGKAKTLQWKGFSFIRWQNSNSNNHLHIIVSYIYLSSFPSCTLTWFCKEVRDRLLSPLFVPGHSSFLVIIMWLIISYPFLWLQGSSNITYSSFLWLWVLFVFLFSLIFKFFKIIFCLFILLWVLVRSSLH